MKRLMLEIVVCLALMFGGVGCEDGLTPEQVQALAAHQEMLQQQVETVQAAATQITESLAAGGIMDEDAVAIVAKLNEEADRVQAQMAIVAQALQGVPLAGDTTQDFIALLQAANTASAGFNPYVAPVGVGLTILSIILGWLARRNAAEAAKAKEETKVVTVKYQAHKQGVEKTMKEVSVSKNAEVQAVEAQLYANIGGARADLNVGA